MFKTTAASIFILSLLSNCAPGTVYLNEDFGNSVKHNIAVQTLNPEGVGQDDSELMDGQKAQQSIERYREGSAEAELRSLLGDALN